MFFFLFLFFVLSSQSETLGPRLAGSNSDVVEILPETKRRFIALDTPRPPPPPPPGIPTYMYPSTCSRINFYKHYRYQKET